MNKLLDLAADIQNICIKKNYSIALAESCTGGMLASILTSVPGCSGYFYGGFVTYSNDAKINMIGVNPTTLKKYGAVSSHTAIEMAKGTKDITNCFLAASITGIAGPNGGTKTKPVGTVYFGIAYKEHMISHHENFTGDRHQIRVKSCEKALQLILDSLYTQDEC